jgi:GT2 family glycosyltransferase/2-polyprenyl-3-methyl-5-hydroxy-6-metoxy-1,4-benzoquinol methylase
MASGPRYDSSVDLSHKNSSHTQLILLTGRDKKVLEAGPATGYMTEALRARGCRVTGIELDAEAASVAAQYCERMVVGNIEEIDFDETFGDEKFDVAMFGDVLEHLLDPEAVLVKVASLLSPNGYVVASIPNVAHASILLNLMAGEFRYTELGLLDKTHLRFFTRSSTEAMFRQTGYRIGLWRRIVLDPFQTELALSQEDYPPHILDAIKQGPESFTYQHIVKAFPAKRRSLPDAGQESNSNHASAPVLQALWQTQEGIQELRETLEERDGELAETRAVLGQMEADLAVKEGLLTETENHLRELQMHIQVITGAVGYRLLERVRRIINNVAPPGSRQRRTLALAKRTVRMVSGQGWLSLLRRAPQVWRWGPKLFRAISAKPDAPLTLDDQYQLWQRAHQLTPSRVRTIKRDAAGFAYKPKVSIIVPTYNPKPSWLREAIDSVRSQLYDNWELCIADDASTKPAVRALLEEYRMDKRIKVVALENNQGISAASNAALSLASGEFIGLLDHDDELKPDSLYEVVSLLNRNRDLDFIYTDEDKKAPDGRLVQAFFKPDWSPELLLSTNYVPHFAVYRKSVVDEVGGWRSECDFSQDYDLALRVTERTDRIAHIPLPLYSWRMVPGSAASELRAKPKSVGAGKRALKDAMERRGVRAVVEDGPYRNTYRVRHSIEEQPLVSIIIPTRDRLDMLRPCITSIERKSTYTNYELVIVDNDSKEEETLRYLEATPHRRLQYPGEFRYAAMMNYAVRETTGEYVILLNNDTAVLSDEWIEAMLEHAQRPGVAAVGVRLLYPDGRPQHEGVVMGAGIGGSCLNVDTRGYFGLGVLVRNVSAVTAACMMVSRQAFEDLDGFDESLRVAFNDVDYCLRALKAGYRVIYTPYATLVHHESASRGSLHPREDEEFFRRRWGKPGQYRDAYYNPNLSRALAYIIETDWPGRQEPQLKPPLAVATGARSR